MRIVVSQLPDAGRTILVQGDWAIAAAKQALDAEPKQLSGTLTLERHLDMDDKEDGRVVVTGHIAVSASRECERCAEDLELVVDADVDLMYAPTVKDEEPEGDEVKREQEDDDDDILPVHEDDGWYQDDVLELGDVLCEAISLELGPRIVCVDVASCDRRTAELLASKGTSGNPGHPAFAKLKGLG